MSAAETFAHFVYHPNAKELVALLLGLSPKEVIEVRKRALEFDGFYCGREESAMLFLTGLAVYTSKEAFKTGFHWSGSLAHDFFDSRATEVNALLAHFRPAWLSEWVLRRDGSSLVDYWRLRQLEEAGFIAYGPEAFTAKLGWEAVSPYKRESLFPKLAQDATACQRDLMQLFEYTETIPRLDCHSYYQYDAYTWVALLVELMTLGCLDRAELLQRSLVALRRDLRRPVLTWFKTLFSRLLPTDAERLGWQAELVELLSHPQSLVVNFAFDQLKSIWSDKGFVRSALLLQAEGLVVRKDVKTGLRTLLAGFDKWLRFDQTQAPAMGRISAASLANADTGVQEKAARFLSSLLSHHEALVSADDKADMVATITQYADLLTPGTRTLLGSWLATPDDAVAALPLAGYQAQLTIAPRLTPETAIASVQDWHELLFLTGQVVRHTDPVAFERWVNGLLELQGHFPATYADQLLPYVKELEHTIMRYDEDFNSIPEEDIPNSPLDPKAILWLSGHWGLVQALLLSWAGEFQVLRVGQVKLANAPHWTSDPLVLVDAERMLLVENRLKQRIQLPLLSSPTHAPAWVAPTALVERLMAHERQGQQFDRTDLVLALARLAWQDPADAQRAITLLPEVKHEGARTLLRWMLSPEEKAVPAARVAEAMKQTGAAWAELWAVAARTKFPQGHFPELTQFFSPTMAEIVEPAAVQWEVKAQSYTETRNWGRYRVGEVSRWHEIQAKTTASATPLAPESRLLYSLHENIWHHSSWSPDNLFRSLQQDFPFAVALVPQHPTPLYWHALRCGADRNDTKPGTTVLLQSVLRHLLEPGPAFDEAATLLLAVGLVHHVPVCRSLATEVLLTSIATSRLIPSALGRVLGELLATEFAPLQRLGEALAKVRAVDALTDEAMRQTLDALLPKLPAEPLRNTRKLLEAYADLLDRAPLPIPTEVMAKLQEWSSYSPLKKLVSAMQ